MPILLDGPERIRRLDGAMLARIVAVAFSRFRRSMPELGPSAQQTNVNGTERSRPRLGAACRMDEIAGSLIPILPCPSCMLLVSQN